MLFNKLIMKKFLKNSVSKFGNASSFISNVIFVSITLILFLLMGCINSKKENTTENIIETYRSTWWHLPYPASVGWGRPTYGVITINNGELNLRHAILEGRHLGDYRLPYWPITSFVSIFKNPIELAHQGSVSLSSNGKKQTIPFRCGDQRYSHNSLSNKRIEEGFELADYNDGNVLKVTNKGSASPILMEHFFVIDKGSCDIPIFIKATNSGDKTIQDVVVQVFYTQDFNWSSFGATDSKLYKSIEIPDSGSANGFFAFSSGMDRGCEFHNTMDCELSYSISQEFNTWKVILQNAATTLAPGASIEFSYNLRLIDKPLKRTSKNKTISKQKLDLLEFTNIKTTEVKTAPVNPDKRITIQNVIQNMEKPKVRGLHRIAGFPKALDDLAILKEWGGNLAITDIGNPNETRQIIHRGHELGIEMFIPGIGSYNTGDPVSFEQLFKVNLKSTEYPDSYGWDDDHYYWYPVKPTLDFNTEFGKPMSEATQEEKVIYWSRCFVDKWRKTLDDVRKHDPKGKIYFLQPMPGIANIDPLDYNNLFLHEVSQLGDILTVFPFYYGIDYDQIEYMMRMWKDAGAYRAVFLPGGPTYAKPSQFLRAITAARRGGADGACGFAFSVSEDASRGGWRWKSVLLASQANFPTLELNAYCFIEEPAELVEALSVSDVYVVSGAPEIRTFVQKLEKILPGKVHISRNLPDNSLQTNQLYVTIGDESTHEPNKWPYDVKRQATVPNKGIIQMVKNVINLNGSDAIGLQNAEKLFLRFAELAKTEGMD